MFNDRFRSGRAMLCALIALFFTTLGFGAAAAQPSPARAQVAAEAPGFTSDRISVEVVGDGPDVVLIHGLASSRETWRGLAQALSGRHRLHLIQVSGFAGAPAPDGDGAVWAPMVDEAARYIREQGLERPAFIGHSMGGASGLMLAQRHPDLIGRVMVVDALPFFSALFGPQVTAASAEPFAAAAHDQVLAADDAAYARMQQGTAATMVADEAARAEVLAWSMASDRGFTARALREIMTTDLREGLADMTTPVTVLYAWHTAMNMPASQTDALYAREYAGLPGARLVRVDEALHFIMLDQPEAFLAQVEAFLAE